MVSAQTTAHLVLFYLSILSMGERLFFFGTGTKTSTTKESSIYIFGFVQQGLFDPLGHNKCSLSLVDNAALCFELTSLYSMLCGLNMLDGLF